VTVNVTMVYVFVLYCVSRVKFGFFHTHDRATHIVCVLYVAYNIHVHSLSSPRSIDPNIRALLRKPTRE